jgi:hypothetical protein
MKYIKLIPLIALFSILIISCGKKSNLGKLIPKNAAMIVDINTKSALSKLSWDEIKKTYWYNKLMNDSSISATSKTFMGDPAKTGIDLNSDIVFFLVQPNDSGHVFLEGNLKDSKVFADFLKSMHPNATVSKEGDLNIFKAEDAVIGWNNDRFVFVAGTNHMRDHERAMMHDSTTQIVPLANPENLVTACKNIFSLSSDNSLYDNERFAKLSSEEGDVHFWLNVNELTKGSMGAMKGMMGMIKLDKFLEDNISTTTANFQDGKITAIHKQYFGKELSDILKSAEGNMNADMVKRLPQNPAAVFAFHFTPASMLEILKLTGLDGFINLFMAQQGVSLDDVVKATKGDIVFSLSDLTVKKDSSWTDTIHGTPSGNVNMNLLPHGTFLFAVAIKDKDAFNKLLNIGKTMGKDMGPKNTFSKSDDKYYAISNSQDAINKYFSGTTSAPDFLSKINDHPVGAFVDLQMILKTMQQKISSDSLDKIQFAKNLSLWNNIYVSGGEYKDGGIVTNAEVNFIDKSTNSLVQLNKYIDENTKIIMEKKKRQRTERRSDSIPNLKTDTTTTLHKLRK